ncbi:replication initiation protein [Fastidiosibacter lacustris]|uniref:replication initiation protein n=1 Tax=Fastidiosibacter lacustris TaxID=2056695 RepID=UPI000E34B299|nr:replication initiation protein [Fastidiosibacter lacustris]
MRMMINNQEIDLDKMQAYIPSLLSEIRGHSTWNVNQIKVFVYILSHYYREKIKITSKELTNEDIESVDLGHLSRNLKLSKDDIISLTGITKAHFARDIRKITEGLKSSIATLPNLDDILNKKSYIQRSWFEEFKYNDTVGCIEVEIDKKVFPYLLVFCHYTRIKISDVLKFKNNYTFDTYIILKLRLNQYKKKDELKLAVEDYKTRVGLHNVYSTNYSMFKKAVLHKIIGEINETDIYVNLEEIKTGRKVTTIVFEFGEKSIFSEKLESLYTDKVDKNSIVSEKAIIKLDGQTLIVSAQLHAYGIPKKKVLEYISNYGVDACKLGIEKLLGEIQKGREINNISGYLVSCIENASNNSGSQEIKATMDAVEESTQARKAQKMERFNSFDSYINKNEQQILVLLSRHEVKEKITDELEIDMLRCLKDVVAQYEDLESMSPYYLTLRFKGDILNYSKIKSFVDELEVASKEERIAKLKAELEAKKSELMEASEQTKGLVEKEIMMLRVAIADLV